ncbi:MAG TPA: hypothetical protein VG389_16660 [Myxococcota bacterium]|jgi:hypothetical protein|nr:hypothetical protein [Myxococcota bacterium]
MDERSPVHVPVGAAAVALAAAAMLLAAAVVGCAPSGDAGEALRGVPNAHVREARVVKTLANTASAPNVFHLTYLIYRGGGDPSCPVARRDEEAAATVVTGGCTDRYGFTWHGTATVVDAPVPGDGDFYYDAFGWDMPYWCGERDVSLTVRFQGAVSVHTTEPRLHEFNVDLAVDRLQYDWRTCAPAPERWGWDYAGSVLDGADDEDRNGVADVHTWNGSGWVGSDTLGLAEAVTNELVDHPLRCADEALSGKLKLWSGLDCATVLYDGASDCDADSTVTWRYDGADRGELHGVPAITQCAVRAVGRRGAGAAGGAGLALLLLPALALTVALARGRIAWYRCRPWSASSRH